MPKNRAQKTAILEEVKKNLKNSKSVIFTDYSGLGANDINELRNELEKTGAKISVVKNSLIKKANTEIDLKGQTAVIYALDKVVESLKILFTFIKKKDRPKIKVGLLNGKIISLERIEEISKLPGLEQLRAKFVGSLALPLSSFVSVNREIYSSFVRVLNLLALSASAELSSADRYKDKKI